MVCLVAYIPVKIMNKIARQKGTKSVPNTLEYNMVDVSSALPPIVRVECLQKESISSSSSEDLQKTIMQKRISLLLPSATPLSTSCPNLAEAAADNKQIENRRKTSHNVGDVNYSLTRHKIPMSALSSPRSSPLLRRKRNGSMYGTISSLTNNPAKSRMDIRDVIEPISLPTSPSSTPRLRRKQVLISPVLKVEQDHGTLVPLSGRSYTVENVSLKHGGLMVTGRPSTREVNTQGKPPSGKSRPARTDSKDSLEVQLKDLENYKSRTCDCTGECEHVPDGMTPESFDRCHMWLEQVEKAKHEKSGLELYTAPPINWNA